jgi:hypothetical protein
MKIKTLGLIGLLLVSCDKTTTADKEFKASQETIDKISDDSLDGIWTDGSEPNASFTIDNDSIRDVEHSLTTKFEMNGDSVTFYYSDGLLKARMYKIHADTLVYEYAGVKTKYWRF